MTAADAFRKIEGLAVEARRLLRFGRGDYVRQGACGHIEGIQLLAQDGLREALANEPKLAAFDGLLAAVENLAYSLNSTPESGPICWCDPNGPAGHSGACDRIRAAIASAQEQTAPAAEVPRAGSNLEVSTD